MGALRHERCGHTALRIAVTWLFAFVSHSWPAASAEEPHFEVRGQLRIVGGDPARPRDPARCVIFLDAHPDLAAADSIDEPPQIAQQDKKFIPDLLVVSQGTSVEFPNWDPYSHNVFSRSRAAPFDLDRYPQGVSKSYTFGNVGLVQIFCNIHPQMRAVVLVVPNRYFTRCDAAGRFALRDVPGGQYWLVAWHEASGAQRQSIDVTPGGSDVLVTLTAQQARASSSATRRRRPPGVDRGLGVKQQRLNLPVIEPSHPAPPRN